MKPYKCDTVIFEQNAWALLKCKDRGYMLNNNNRTFIAHTHDCETAKEEKLDNDTVGVAYISLDLDQTLEGRCVCGVVIDPNVLSVWYLHNFDKIAED